MFDKLQQAKDLLKLRSKAKELQRELEQIQHTQEKGGIKVVVNGAQEVQYIEVNGESQEELRKVINEAVKEVQKKAAKKMMEMGGGLSGLLGGM